MRDKEKTKAPKKRKKEKFEDDGRTVADMNVEGMPWYRGKNYKPNETPKLSREEKRAVFKGAFLSLVVPLLCTLAGLAAAGILIWLWLH